MTRFLVLTAILLSTAALSSLEYYADGRAKLVPSASSISPATDYQPPVDSREDAEKCIRFERTLANYGADRFALRRPAAGAIAQEERST
jgi:hypothetical protein